ncbi:MAG: hypothetical protein ACJ79S_06310 [Gemmatimonadaceae bacterium]
MSPYDVIVIGGGATLHNLAVWRRRVMSNDLSATAPTTLLDAAGIRFAYRRVGTTDGVPLLFLQHFTGTMDS